MILVIPSIELKSGFCTHCIIGEKGTENYYQRLSRDPVELVKLLRRENTKTIHIIDKDSIDNIDNSENFKNIIYITQSLDIPIEVSGNFKNGNECKKLLDNGVYRIFVDELLVTNKNEVENLIDEFGASRICFNAVLENNSYEYELNKTKVSCYDYFQLIKEVKGNRILFGKKSWAHNNEIDFDLLDKVAEKYKFRMTISEGINSPELLWKFSDKAKLGIDSVIIGKALYDNNFPCQKIWRQIEAIQEPI